MYIFEKIESFRSKMQNLAVVGQLADWRKGLPGWRKRRGRRRRRRRERRRSNGVVVV